MKRRLTDAAASAGRNLSQEAETRLERSFRDEQLVPQVLDAAYGPEIAGLLMLMGAAMRRVEIDADFALRETDAGAVVNWTEHSWKFSQICAAVGTILDRISPSEAIEEPSRLKAGGAWEGNQATYFRSLGEQVALRMLFATVHPGDRDLAPFGDAVVERLGAFARKRNEDNIRRNEDHLRRPERGS